MSHERTLDEQLIMLRLAARVDPLLREAVADVDDAVATLTAERDQLIEWRNTVGRGQGCGCNNGDGEEWCVGTCIAKAQVDALRTALEAADGMFNEMHPHTQGHMAENCTLRTDFCGAAMVVREALGGKS